MSTCIPRTRLRRFEPSGVHCSQAAHAPQQLRAAPPAMHGGRNEERGIVAPLLALHKVSCSLTPWP